MRRKKILHVITHFHPFIGGLENMVFDLASAQSEKHDVFVLMCQYDKSLPLFEEIEGIKIYRFPAFSLIKNRYAWPKFGFSKKIKEINPEVIFTHTRFFATSFFGQKFQSKITKKIHVEHGQNFVRSKNIFIKIFARIFDETLGKSILRSADKIVTLGNEGKKFVKVLSGRPLFLLFLKNLFWRSTSKKADNIFVIPNGIRIPEKIIKIPRKNRAIFFGRIIPEKGVEEILLAAQKCQNWSFDFYGEVPKGATSFSQKFLSAVDLQGNIFFHGEIPPLEISEKIQEADLVILPSWSEGNSLAILEAAANGRAILATPVGQNEVIVQPNFLVPVRNVEELIGKLNWLENNWEMLERGGKENLERVKKHYCFEQMMAAYEGLL